MKQDKQKHNWLIDAALFGSFLGSLWLDLTGVAVHQWLGLAVGGLAIYHLVRHWSWMKAVTARFFGRTSRQSRTFYAVDAGLAVGFATILGTGLVISTWANLALAGYAAWHTVHVVASVATLALLVAKIGLHWRWIVDVARRRVFPAQTPVGRTVQPSVAQPARAAGQIPLDRRDFVRLMAGVGAVALLAGTHALSSVVSHQVEASSAAQTASDAQAGTATTSTSSATQTASGAQTGTATTSTSSACIVRCNRQCSYPGHCRRYTDSNNNGQCDFGECLS